MPLPSVSVVVPALNEARNIPHVFARMPADVHEVVLVDGYSVDGTVNVARQLWPDVRIARQTRAGKGNALACGFALATGDIIAMIDADGSADPSEIPRFVEALLDGADFAKGTRFVEGGGSSDITRLRSAGNYVLTAFFNACYSRSYSDLCYGFNVFWRRHAPVLGLDATSPPRPDGDGRLWGDGFEVETLIHVRAAKAGLVVAEVPSFEHPRIHGVSNLNAFRDGRRVLQTILTERRRTQLMPAAQPPVQLRPDTAALAVHEGSVSSGDTSAIVTDWERVTALPQAPEQPEAIGATRERATADLRNPGPPGLASRLLLFRPRKSRSIRGQAAVAIPGHTRRE
jgi:Glycosyl transferase family 2